MKPYQLNTKGTVLTFRMIDIQFSTWTMISSVDPVSGMIKDDVDPNSTH